MYDLMRLNALSSMTAEVNDEKSVTSPIFRESRKRNNSGFSLGQRDSGIYAREQAEHFWPQNSKAARIVPVATVCMSADGWTK